MDIDERAVIAAAKALFNYDADPAWSPGEKAAQWLAQASHYRMRAHAALDAAMPVLNKAKAS